MGQRIAKLHVGRLAVLPAMFAMVAGCAAAPRGSELESADVMEEGKESSQREARAQGAATRVEQDDVASEAVGADEEPADEVDASSAARGANSHAQDEIDVEPDSSAPVEISAGPAGDDSSTPSKVDPEPHASPSVDAEPSAAPSHAEPSASPSVDSESNTPPAASEPSAEPGAASGSADEGAPHPHTVCGTISIRSRADVESARHCSEIDGDLTVRAVGLTAIDATDLPLLTKITGDLVIAGPQATDAPHLTTVTLAQLRTVEGAVIVTGVSVPEFGASGPLQELHLPALERIGAHGDVGLIVFQAALKVLDLPALVAVDGSVVLNTLLELCTLRADKLQKVGGELQVHYVPRLSPSQLESLRAAAAGQVDEALLGCCATDGGVACEAFTENARALYCTAC